MTPTGDAGLPDTDRIDTVPIDDAELIRASVTEPDRFAELFRRHADAVGRYLVRRIGTQDADDVLADTFLEAFWQRRRYDAGRPDARPWLYGIATKRLGRYRRTELKQLVHLTHP